MPSDLIDIYSTFRYDPSLNQGVTTNNIRKIVGRRAVGGQVGLEIEVEGNQFPKTSIEELGDADDMTDEEYEALGGGLIPEGWSHHIDHSLRGEDNAEYVLSRPIKFDEVPAALSKLWDMFDAYGSVLDDSNRTSVHVHLNVQNFSLSRLCSFSALYLSVEEILAEWCGEHRVGNLFCLRAVDAPAIVTDLKKWFVSNGQTYIPDHMHYAGFNAQALHKFGSIEIRTLRGCQTPEPIILWVEVLRRIYDLSESFEDPRMVCAEFSGIGPLAYLRHILGDKYNDIVDNIEYTEGEIRDAIYRGIRLAQDLCYCRDWSLKEDSGDSPEPESPTTLPDLFPEQVTVSYWAPPPASYSTFPT